MFEINNTNYVNNKGLTSCTLQDQRSDKSNADVRSYAFLILYGELALEGAADLLQGRIRNEQTRI
jgi:hypothetical protein